LYFDTEVPKQVLVPLEPADKGLIEEWLGRSRGTRVSVRTPQRGEKRVLLQTVNENARQAFAQHKLKRASDFAARTRQLNELRDALEMPDAPLRIECFDISNTGPTEAVGSMVVFEDGLPKRSDYRRFAIKWTRGPDDFAMMAEVIRRRFARSQEPEKDGARRYRFAYPPNLVVIDGGKGQLAAATQAMDELGVAGVTTISLAKRMEEVFVPGRAEPVSIPRTSEALYLLQQVRDEAHRFALTYHQLRRGKRMTASVLDPVPGLGSARRKLLLKHFGSVKAMRQASREDLAGVPGIPATVAEALYLALHPGLGAQSNGEQSPSDRSEAS
jgi:excinuclease ABC subunit C